MNSVLTEIHFLLWRGHCPKDRKHTLDLEGTILSVCDTFSLCATKCIYNSAISRYDLLINLWETKHRPISVNTKVSIMMIQSDSYIRLDRQPHQINHSSNPHHLLKIYLLSESHVILFSSLSGSKTSLWFA